MQILRLVGVTFFLLVCQATWVPSLAIFGVTPDLFVALVFWVAVRRGPQWGTWIGFALGLLLDVEQPEQLGMNTLALAVAGAAVGFGSRQLERGNPLVHFLLLFLSSLLAETMRTGWLVSAGSGSFLGLWFRFALPGAIYTAALIPLASRGLAFLLGRKDWILSAP